MNKQHYLDLLENFKNVRVLSVGDIYLDEYVYGVMTEISLEAPIPVMEVQERRYNPGAAGNAACNAAALGGQVSMVGVVGQDANADIVKHEFEVRNVDTANIVNASDRPTNTYGKLRAGGHNIPNQEVLRTDTPKPTLLEGEVEAQVIERIRAMAPKVDCILIGDQVTATITQKVLDCIVECAEQYNLVTVADSRGRAGMFKGIDVVVPNDAEACLAAGIKVEDEDSLNISGKHLITTAKNALVTLGEKGIACFAADGSLEIVPIQPVRAVDVTGAGDTVAAAVILTLASGGSLVDAATMGNLAAGIAVQQQGVVTVANEEVKNLILHGNDDSGKVKALPKLQEIVGKLKKDGKRIVWTNGCFDILHVGHVTYLLSARDQGDALVVGLNSDASVQAVKGPDRPVVPEAERARVLAALECVDYVVVFDDKTPMALLETLQPDVYVKGGDYSVDTIVQEERKLVESYGGEIAIIPAVEGHSTTTLIEKMAQG